MTKVMTISLNFLDAATDDFFIIIGEKYSSGKIWSFNRNFYHSLPEIPRGNFPSGKTSLLRQKFSLLRYLVIVNIDICHMTIR